MAHGGCEEEEEDRERRRLPETAAERPRRRRSDMAVAFSPRLVDGLVVLFGC